MTKDQIKAEYQRLLAEIRLYQEQLAIVRAEIKVIQTRCEYSGHVYPKGGTVCKYCGHDSD